MLTNIEKETIVTFNEAESECSFFTYNKKLIEKLEKKCESCPKIYSKVGFDKFGGMTFRFPKKHLSIRFSEPISEELAEIRRKVAENNGWCKKPTENRLD